jgi:AraC-like DNA-binding protein
VGDRSGNDVACRTGFDRVDPRILASFPELVRELGGDPSALLGRVGIDPEADDQKALAVSYRQMVDLLALAASELNCPDIGMQLAKRQAGAIQTPLLEVVRNSRTLGEALEHVISLSYAHSLAAAIWLKRCPAEETVMIGHDILIEGSPDRRQAIEQILLIEYLTRRDVTGGFACARRVDFRHQPISPPAVYRAHFGCEVRFRQHDDAIVYGEQVLGYPILAPDPLAYDRTIADISTAFAKREPPFHVRVRGVVTHLLGGDRCANVNVASELGLHVRTLHRRLREEGTSFQRIKNEVRRDFLIHYLDQTDLPVAEVSERLGFAEQSATSRFCRQVLGSSPRQRKARAEFLSADALSEMGKSRRSVCPKKRAETGFD